jgi:hypothetical protein
VVSASDTTQHGEALSDALDVARLFRRANDSGIGMTRPLLRSIEELVQATATAVPKLMAPDLEAAVRVTQVLLCGSVFRNINKITDDYLRHHGSIRFAACFTPAFALVSFLCFSGMIFAGVSLTAIAFAHVAFLAASWLVKLAWLSSPWSSGDGAGVGRGSEWIRVSWLATLAAQMFLLAYYAAA